MGTAISLQRFLWCGDDRAVALRNKLEEAETKISKLQHQITTQNSSWKVLHVTSPLTEVNHTQMEMHDSTDFSRCWQSWCPCCKRPLDVTAFSSPDRNETHRHQSTEHKYAYVTTLWGEDSGFVVGALALGAALQRTKTMHDLVLMHTHDIPTNSLAMLRRVWRLYEVDYVKASENLFLGGSNSRFSGVFTKLHALGLTAYDKVLLLDIDLTIFDNIDALFNLQAPAALWRGYRQTKEHGYRIDGRCFFGGPDDDWGQTGGINAGVMLLAPDAVIHQRALREVEAPSHPERIAGAGPEQDYLSRLFAHDLKHLSVLYNFQIHHVIHGLTMAVQEYTGISNEALPTSHLAQPDIQDGSWLYCNSVPEDCDELPVFESPHCHEIVGKIPLGATVFATSPPILWNGCPMVSIRQPEGAVDSRHVGVLAKTGDVNGLAQVKPGTRVECISKPQQLNGLPVFASTHCTNMVCTVRVGTQMIVAADIMVSRGCPMVPIRHPRGAIDGRYLRVLNNSTDTANSDDTQNQKKMDRIECNMKNLLTESSTNNTYPQQEDCEGHASVWVPPRLTIDPEELFVIHFSGVLKMWDWNLIAGENITDFVERFLCNNCPFESRLWLSRTGSDFEYFALGVKFATDRGFTTLDEKLPAKPLDDMINATVARLKSITKRAAWQWYNDLHTFLKLHTTFASPEELLRSIGSHRGYLKGDEVELFWKPEQRWYTAVVEQVLEKGKLKLMFYGEFAWPPSVFTLDDVRLHVQKGQPIQLYWDSEHRWYSAFVRELLNDDKLLLEFDVAYGWPPAIFSMQNIRLHHPRHPRVLDKKYENSTGYPFEDFSSKPA